MEPEETKKVLSISEPREFVSELGNLTALLNARKDHVHRKIVRYQEELE